MDFTATFVRYERVGDVVTPLRVVKQWITNGPSRVYAVTRVTTISFPKMPYPDVPVAFPREILLQRGLVWRSDHDWYRHQGMPCLAREGRDMEWAGFFEGE